MFQLFPQLTRDETLKEAVKMHVYHHVCGLHALQALILCVYAQRSSWQRPTGREENRFREMLRAIFTSGVHQLHEGSDG